jgi:sterol desaturase/sphingolipid hydroxylase (fatty acid hydroxylase superfamily)
MELIEQLNYLANTHQRIFWLYLLTSALIAALFVAFRPAYRSVALSRAVWWHPSARLDYGYFLLSAVIKLAVIVPLVLGAGQVAFGVLSTLKSLFGHLSPLGWDKTVIAALYTVCIFVVSDFTRYWLHRWLHTVPLLWRFHRVHHSAEVLNPLTFYRIHPVENLLFGLRYSLSAGVVTGVFIYLFGARLGLIDLLGANALVVLFALAGSNLRHSHIPVGFGHALERWLVSPRMHQFHHSPKGLRTNYGGSLSIWDRLFGSLKLIERPADRFGLNGPNPHPSVMALLFEPFYPTRKETTP